MSPGWTVTPSVWRTFFFIQPVKAKPTIDVDIPGNWKPELTTAVAMHTLIHAVVFSRDSETHKTWVHFISQNNF